ncbi:hypothetical protein EDB19DRAFT_2024442 [Suillus lakei]|nr:hypothetical protein EDB19DRAFT_2024442 [Suillus lakei]
MLSLHVLVLSALALSVTATMLPYHNHEVAVGCQTTCASQQCHYDSDCGSSCYCANGSAVRWCCELKFMYCSRSKVAVRDNGDATRGCSLAVVRFEPEPQQRFMFAVPPNLEAKFEPFERGLDGEVQISE